MTSKENILDGPPFPRQTWCQVFSGKHYRLIALHCRKTSIYVMSLLFGAQKLQAICILILFDDDDDDNYFQLYILVYCNSFFGHIPYRNLTMCLFLSSKYDDDKPFVDSIFVSLDNSRLRLTSSNLSGQ